MSSTFQVALVVKNQLANAGDPGHRFNPWVWKIPWSKKWHPPPVFLPGKFHGQRSLASYSPWGHKESDTTEHMNIYGGSGTELRSHMHCIVITIILGESNYYYAHLIGEERGLENFQGHRIFQWKIQGLTPVSQSQSKSYLL